MIIQPLLIIGIILIALFTINKLGKSQVSAIKKIAVGWFALFASAVVIMPELSNDVAHALGVGRGADLLLYMLTLAFLLFVIGQYSRSRTDRVLLNRLARQLALSSANMDESNQKKLTKVRVSSPIH